MKTRSTIIWLLVLLLLGGFAYYYEFVVEEQRKQEEKESQKVFLFDPLDILELKLTRNEATISCVKGEKGSWSLTGPVQEITDEAVVMSILNGLQGVGIDRVIAEKIDDPANFGLDKPEYDIEFKSKDKTFHLIIGKKNPTDRFFYTRYADQEKLFLIPYSISYSLNKELFEFRDKIVLSANIKTTYSVEIESGGQVIHLARQGEGGWKVIEPKIVNAGIDEVDKYITSISILRIKKFLTKKESDPQVTGLDSPSLVITIIGEDKKEVGSILIGKRNNKTNRYYSRRGSNEEVFMLDGADIDSIKRTPDDFRPKQFFSFDKKDVQIIKLSHSGSGLVLKREEEGWKLESSGTGPVNNLSVLEFLSDVLDLRAEKYLDGPAKAEYGFDKPSMKVTLQYKGKKEKTMLVGNKVENNYYVSVGSQNYLVIAVDVNQLKQDPNDFRQDGEKEKE